MRSWALFLAVGVGLVLAAALLGDRAGLIGGTVALAAQVWAVAILRPKMRAPNPQFMARWLGGMGIRLLGLGVVLVVTPTLPGLIAYLAVLLPLLFLETRFLR